MADIRPPGPLSIERCVAAHQRIQHALQVDEALAGDEQSLLALVGADPNTLAPEELLRRFVAAIRFAESRASEAKTFADAMTARRKRYATRAAVMRSELLEVMQALDVTSYSGSPFGTISVRGGPQSVVVLDEQLVPERYWNVIRALNKSDLLKALKAGEVIDGAVLSNPMPALAIRGDKPVDENGDEC